MVCKGQFLFFRCGKEGSKKLKQRSEIHKITLQFLTQTGTPLTKERGANSHYTGSTGLNWTRQGKPGRVISLEFKPRTIDSSVYAPESLPLRIHFLL